MRKIGRNNGYQLIYMPNHPRAWKTGYVYEHIVVMEAKLGRPLTKGEIVHHKDKNKLNNDPVNLELMTQSQHAKHHTKPITLVECVCSWCQKPFLRRKGNDAEVKGYKNTFCSRSCMGKKASQNLV